MTIFARLSGNHNMMCDSVGLCLAGWMPSGEFCVVPQSHVTDIAQLRFGKRNILMRIRHEIYILATFDFKLNVLINCWFDWNLKSN